MEEELEGICGYATGREAERWVAEPRRGAGPLRAPRVRATGTRARTTGGPGTETMEVDCRRQRRLHYRPEQTLKRHHTWRGGRGEGGREEEGRGKGRRMRERERGGRNRGKVGGGEGGRGGRGP